MNTIRRKISDGITVRDYKYFNDKITGMKIFEKLSNTGLNGNLLTSEERYDLLNNNDGEPVTFLFGKFALWIYKKNNRYYTGIKLCSLYFLLDETNLETIIEKLTPHFTEVIRSD